MTTTTKLAAVILAAFMLVGCMSAERANEIAAENAGAKSALAIIDEQLDGLRADLAAIKSDDPDSQARIDSLVATINAKTATAQEWLSVIDETAGKLADGQNGWDWAETLAGVAAGFFPPLAVGVPMIRRGRVAFEGVVASVAAGGGPINPQATRDAMKAVPGLKERVTAMRVKIGDKRMEAVKVAS